MIIATLREYKENYKINLDIFLNNYEENNESFFLQNELKKYQNYHDVLTEIPELLNYKSQQELIKSCIHSGVASKLKTLSISTYNNIVTELKKPEVTINRNDFSEQELMKDLITINLDKLDNYTKSSILIVEFIANKINPPSLASQIYKSDKIANVTNIPKKLDESENNNNAIEQIPILENLIKTFKWKSNSDIQHSTILWQKLKDENFIASSTELKDFHKAFKGLTNEQPLGISWTAKGKNKHINKHLLFYLLDKLTKKNLIDITKGNKPLFEKINFVFCKENGSQILNLDVSHSTFLNKNKNKDVTFEEEIIDDIIDILLQITAKK